MRRLRPHGRIAAVVLAVLWVTAPIMGLIHAVSESHTYCVEHGTFEEQPTPNDSDSADLDDIAALVAGSQSGEQAHEACAYSPFATSAATLQAHHAHAKRSFPPPEVLHPDHATPPPPLAILAVAPKCSPPSVVA